MESILFNIQCDVPNKNGRIYPRAVVEEMVERMNHECIPVLITIGRPEGREYTGVDLSSVIGRVEGAHITETGDIAVKYVGIERLSAYFDLPHELVSVGVGKINNGVVNDYRLTSLAMIPKEDGDGN